MYVHPTKHFEFVSWPMLDMAWIAGGGFTMFRFFPPEFYFRHNTHGFYKWWIRLGYFEVRRLRNVA